MNGMIRGVRCNNASDAIDRVTRASSKHIQFYTVQAEKETTETLFRRLI